MRKLIFVIRIIWKMKETRYLYFREGFEKAVDLQLNFYLKDCLEAVEKGIITKADYDYLANYKEIVYEEITKKA